MPDDNAIVFNACFGLERSFYPLMQWQTGLVILHREVNLNNIKKVKNNLRN